MKDFNIFLPTKIIFGGKRIREISAYIPAGCHRILLVTDQNAALKSGAQDVILKELSKYQVFIFDRVEENPSFNTVTEGKQMAQVKKCDLIIGLGGGSPMDAAKGIAILSKNEISFHQLLQERNLSNSPLPIICIPTTSGTGSEVTPYAVLTDTKNQNKCGYANPYIFPACSIIDPQLTYSMPKNLVINTGLDALSHAVEAYLSTISFPFTDQLALWAVGVILKHLHAASQKQREAMDMMAYAAMIAGIAISHSGTILPHIMGYPLTLFHQIPHGLASAILLPRFLNFLEKKSTDKNKITHLKTIFSAHGSIESFISSFDISTDLSTYNIRSEEIPLFINKTIVKSDIHITPAQVSEQDIKEIYDL